METTFTPGVPAGKDAQERFRKMREATEKLAGAASVDLTEEGMNMADALRSIRTNYGVNTIVEDLKTSPADPSKKNTKPMKCTKCQYHGEPAHDGKCKECGEPMVPMSSSMEAYPQDDDQGEAPMGPPQSMPPSNGDPGGGAAPPPGMGMPGGSTMPPGEPDDGSDDDFDPSDVPSPEVGEMVAYAVTAPGPRGRVRGSVGRVMLVYRGEASIDTGRKDSVGRSITHKLPLASLTRIPESLLTSPRATNGRTVDTWDSPSHRPTVEARSTGNKSRAQKLIEQVANGRRTADDAVKALLS